MKLTFVQLLALPQGQDFFRRDHSVYLADRIVRSVMAGDRRGLAPGDIIEAGNGTLTVTEESYIFAPANARKPAEPTVIELAVRFAGAVSGWITAGAPVVSEAEYQQRAAVCESCPLWDGAARGGLGHCRHGKCGCTRLKRWLATERCPLDKWPQYPTS